MLTVELETSRLVKPARDVFQRFFPSGPRFFPPGPLRLGPEPEGLALKPGPLEPGLEKPPDFGADFDLKPAPEPDLPGPYLVLGFQPVSVLRSGREPSPRGPAEGRGVNEPSPASRRKGRLGAAP